MNNPLLISYPCVAEYEFGTKNSILPSKANVTGHLFHEGRVVDAYQFIFDQMFTFLPLPTATSLEAIL